MTDQTQVLLLDLVDEPAAIAAYDAWHAAGAVPAAVVAAIRRAGILDMQIFRAGNRLVMLVESESHGDSPLKAISNAAEPEVVAWERRMGSVQRPIAVAEPENKWTQARCIFALREQC